MFFVYFIIIPRKKLADAEDEFCNLVSPLNQTIVWIQHILICLAAFAISGSELMKIAYLIQNVMSTDSWQEGRAHDPAGPSGAAARVRSPQRPLTLCSMPCCNAR